MKNIVFVFTFILALFLVTGCQTNSTSATTPNSAPEVHNYILDGSSWRKDASATGYSVFVEMNSKSTSQRDTTLLASIKSKTEEKLKSLGFKIVAKRSEAHVWILFDYKIREYPEAFPDQNIDTQNGKTLGKATMSEEFLLAGKRHKYQVSSDEGPIGDLQMAVYGQDYGQRFQLLSSKRIRGPASSIDFAVGMEKTADAWIQDLADLKPMVKEKKQAGPPGCMPRFGFEHETFLMEGVPYRRISSVLPKSPASKAGLKVGDVILAIDSIPYDEFARENEKSAAVYNSKASVPIKFIRKTQEMRSDIKAKVMCDE